MPRCKVAQFRTEGDDRKKTAKECWEKALSFARQNQLNDKICKIYQYTKGFDMHPPFYHVVIITLSDEFEEINCIISESVKYDTFSGGTYMTVFSSLEQLGETWMLMEKWRKKTKTKYARHQWVEEWFLENWSFPYKKIKVLYPIP